jgi:hypothetical protein
LEHSEADHRGASRFSGKDHTTPNLSTIVPKRNFAGSPPLPQMLSFDQKVAASGGNLHSMTMAVPGLQGFLSQL